MHSSNLTKLPFLLSDSLIVSTNLLTSFSLNPPIEINVESLY